MTDQIIPPARYVELLNGVVRVGQLAGTAARHPFAPDDTTGSSCRACYGWADDPRHLAAPAMATAGVGGRPGWRRA
jgi:hypothetical protein